MDLDRINPKVGGFQVPFPVRVMLVPAVMSKVPKGFAKTSDGVPSTKLVVMAPIVISALSFAPSEAKSISVIVTS